MAPVTVGFRQQTSFNFHRGYRLYHSARRAASNQEQKQQEEQDPALHQCQLAVYFLDASRPRGKCVTAWTRVWPHSARRPRLAPFPRGARVVEEDQMHPGRDVLRNLHPVVRASFASVAAENMLVKRNIEIAAWLQQRASSGQSVLRVCHECMS